MKALLPLLLAVSLLANIAMLAAVVTKSRLAPATLKSEARSTTASIETTTPVATRAVAAGEQSDNRWPAPTRENLPGLIERLRFAGYPPHVIRAIVTSLVNELFAERRQALEPSAPDTPFWKSTNGLPFGVTDGPSADIRLARRELDRERKDLLEALLGPDTSEASLNQMVLRSRFGPLSPDKLEKVQAIIADYGDLRRELSMTAGLSSMRLPADIEKAEKVALLAREERADLAAVLTPEELFEYEVRASGTAVSLRSMLAGFRPTEEEFRRIFQALHANEATRGLPTSVQSPADRQKNLQNLADQLQGVLSTDRLADYRVATDPSSQRLARLLARFEVPLQKATEITAIQRETMQQAAAVRANRTLDRAQQSEQLATLARNAEARLAQAIGERALAAYREPGATGGTWLRLLSPATPTPRQTNP